MGSASQHWDDVYATKAQTDLSWHQDRPEGALAAITQHCQPGQAIIDVGGGTSHLVDALLDQGLGPVTVLDISQNALKRARARLGDRAGQVDWQNASITDWEPGTEFAFWHDRAVFHFLTEKPQRAAYVGAMATALAPGAVAMISTFDQDGPAKCSGLPVRRYAPAQLAAEIDAHAPGQFDLETSWHHEHLTPARITQKFQTCLFRKR